MKGWFQAARPRQQCHAQPCPSTLDPSCSVDGVYWKSPKDTGTMFPQSLDHRVFRRKRCPCSCCVPCPSPFKKPSWRAGTFALDHLRADRKRILGCGTLGRVRRGLAAKGDAVLIWHRLGRLSEKRDQAHSHSRALRTMTPISPVSQLKRGIYRGGPSLALPGHLSQKTSHPQERM